MKLMMTRDLRSNRTSDSSFERRVIFHWLLKVSQHNEGSQPLQDQRVTPVVALLFLFLNESNFTEFDQMEPVFQH